MTATRDTRPDERQRGPVVLRREQRNEPTTTDQRLLDSRGPTDWVHTDPWRVLRIQAEFVEGFGALSELGPAVSIFGSARTKPDDPMYEAGRQIAAKLCDQGYAIITGGGPGAMEAANRGASESGGVSVGLGIELPHEQGLNVWVDIGINFRYFFVVLPGGFGTMDELFEALTLAQTGKITSFPIVLFGTEYWGGLIDWLRSTMLADGKVRAADIDMLHLTDDVDEAVSWFIEQDV